jgi:hypothetical protein
MILEAGVLARESARTRGLDPIDQTLMREKVTTV